jgi:magnesium transporter
VALGLVLGAVALCMVATIWGDAGVGLAVGLAIVAASSIATVVALALPWVFHRFGSDPAFGSGPLATVIQDVLSVTIYFAIAAQVAV